MAEWRERPLDAEAVEALVAAGFPPLVARLLALRAVTPASADAYFNPALRELSPYGELPGVEQVAEVMLTAVREGRKIVVFGDYDCDGICATAILVRTLCALTQQSPDEPGLIVPFLPDRLSEGYGMNRKSVARLLTEHPDVGLVVTVDNGINSVEEVRELKQRGVAVVVTDHHLPGSELPECPIVDPKVDSPEALNGLCGAGVAFLVANAVIAKAKTEGLYEGGSLAAPLIVLAGLATVTDIMPLRGQNRILVVAALQLFRKFAPIGLRELLDRASRTAAPVLACRDFGFAIGPRINAAGRVGSALDALKLVLATDREQAREYARRVDLCNAERKSIEQGMSEEAIRQIVPAAAAQVIDLPNGHPGVAGIVASRVLERLATMPGGKPVPVCVVVGDHGSARAPEGYNVRDAFEACAEDLVRFGGHAAAGGFSVRDGRLESFRQAFAAACSAQSAATPTAGGVMVDAWVTGRELSLEIVERLLAMAPFGEANPEPVFAMRSVRFADIAPMGADGRHLQATFRGDCPRAVWWGRGDRVEALRADCNRPYDLLFTVEISTWNDVHVELRLLDARPTLSEEA